MKAPTRVYDGRAREYDNILRQPSKLIAWSYRCPVCGRSRTSNIHKAHTKPPRA